MTKLNMTESEKHEIIELVKQGKPLPKEYIYKLYAGRRGRFPVLEWAQRNRHQRRAALSFHRTY
jgi:hypothetical protein